MAPDFTKIKVNHLQEADGSVTPLDQGMELDVPPLLGMAINELNLSLENLRNAMKLSWKRRMVQLATFYPSYRQLGGFRYPEIANFRDPEWEALERPFHETALKRLNDHINTVKEAIASTALHLPLYTLDGELQFVLENTIKDIYAALPSVHVWNALEQAFRLTSGANSNLQRMEFVSRNIPVYLPLERLDVCTVCDERSDLRLCASCGEQIYCSRECQRQDWAGHKRHCGKTDKLDLQTFYPFIAILIDAVRIAPERPLHEACVLKIANSPNPGMLKPSILPDGTIATVIQLGEPCNVAGEGRLAAWWPTAQSPNVARILNLRIEREGWLVPILTAVCYSLLSTIYTTTWSLVEFPDGFNNRRIRFQHRGHPVVDFGIAKGVLDLAPERVRVYYKQSGDPLPKVQDPSDHYWIYFTTLGGEDIILDCGLYSYDQDGLILAPQYMIAELLDLAHVLVPARLEDKSTGRHILKIHQEKKRFSVLRNTNLQETIKPGLEDPEVLWKFMDQVAGRECSEMEKYLGRAWVHRACNAMATVLKERSWEGWPSEPTYVVEDPLTGDMEFPKPIGDKKLEKEMTRLTRRYNKGEIGRQELERELESVLKKARGRRS